MSGILRCSVLFLLAALTAGCGYRVASGRSPILPQQVKTIAVPVFTNQTFEYKIEQSLTAAVIHELLTRTRYRVQSSTEKSDAIVRGIVTSISSGAIEFDPNTGRTTKVLITVGVRVSVVDSKTGQLLRNASDMVFREPYELSSDPTTYFAEGSPAVARLSRDVAASLVSTIVNDF